MKGGGKEIDEEGEMRKKKKKTRKDASNNNDNLYFIKHIMNSAHWWSTLPTESYNVICQSRDYFSRLSIIFIISNARGHMQNLNTWWSNKSKISLERTHKLITHLSTKQRLFEIFLSNLLIPMSHIKTDCAVCMFFFMNFW